MNTSVPERPFISISHVHIFIIHHLYYIFKKELHISYQFMNLFETHIVYIIDSFLNAFEK